MSLHRTVSAAFAVALIFTTVPAFAEVVAVIGTGRMGGAIGPRFAETGHTVIYGTRDPASEKIAALLDTTGENASAKTQNEAIAASDIVVLALPWSATERLIKANKDSLDGKIIMDITNATLKALQPNQEGAIDSSAGALIQEWAPTAKVVKAFNTVGYHIVADPAHAKGPVTVPLVGNDEDAKESVARIVQAMGFETMILGGIEQAHVLEGMANLYFVPYGTGRFDEAFEYYFRKGTAPAGIGSSQVRGAD
ncbi:MAG: NADPH-dependent F420 reductase [Rhodospirillaceae bacterium]